MLFLGVGLLEGIGYYMYTHPWYQGPWRPTWGPYGANGTQVGPMLAPWTLLSGMTPFTCGKASVHGGQLVDKCFEVSLAKCICIGEKPHMAFGDVFEKNGTVFKKVTIQQKIMHGIGERRVRN